MKTGTGSKKDGLSREQVAELYTDVRKAMSQLKASKGVVTADDVKSSSGTKMDAGAAKQIAMAIRQAMARDDAKAAQGSSAATSAKATGRPAQKPVGSYTAPDMGMSSFEHVRSVPQARGPVMALGIVMILGAFKLAIGGLELIGVLNATPAVAAMQQRDSSSNRAFVSPGSMAGGYSREEAKILQSLDARRVELNERAKKLDEREAEFAVRDREFTIRTQQLKELSEKLRVDRERSEKRKDAQVEQLANVYSSMGPQEAAQLLEQLDVTIALPLIERMPEKKIGQILSLMSKERALMLTKMLSAAR